MQAIFLDSDNAADWGGATRLAIGESSVDVGAVVASVGVRTDDGRRWRIDLCHGVGQSHRSELRCAGTTVFIGYGEQAATFSAASGQIRSYRLDGYFGGFETAVALEGADESLFATSASELLRFDVQGNLSWRADQLGIDGVVLHRVAGDTIEGSGEWDPPGGWEPFRLRLGTGERLAPA